MPYVVTTDGSRMVRTPAFQAYLVDDRISCHEVRVPQYRGPFVVFDVEIYPELPVLMQKRCAKAKVGASRAVEHVKNTTNQLPNERSLDRMVFPELEYRII